MGELYTTLEEFTEISQEYYRKVIKLLQDKYCWKCPQRSTSGQISCREVDAWIRLLMAFESGVMDSIENDPDSQHRMGPITTRFMQKTRRKTKRPGILILMTDQDYNPYLKKGTFILIEEGTPPKNGELVLISQICPIYNYLHLKLDLTDFPFKVEKVDNIFLENGVRYLSTVEGSKIPLEHRVWLINRIISKDDSLFEELGLGRIKRRNI